MDRKHANAAALPTVVLGRSSDSERFQTAIDRLRRAGCRCVLQWNGEDAVPISTVDANTCAVDHRKEMTPCGSAT